MTINELNEVEARKAEIRSALEAGDNVSKEDIEKFRAELKDLDVKSAELRERLTVAAGINTNTIPSAIIKPAEKQTTGNLDSEEYRMAFKDYCATGKMAEEFRATATTANNGAVIPPTVLNQIVEKMEVYGNILPLVSKTAYPAGFSIPVGEFGLTASWVAEGSGSAQQGASINTQITFGAYKLQCRVAVTLEMSVKALSAFESALINNVSKAMTKALEQAIISGDGSAKCKGIITETVDSGRQIEVSTFDYKALMDVEGAIPQAYDNGGVYVMTKKSWLAFERMTDTAGQPITRVNIGLTGKPERQLLGRQVVLTDYLPSYDAADSGDVFAFVFDFSNYTLNTGYDLTVRKYIDEATDDIVTKATMLVDGKCVDSNGLVLLKKA